jgi:hypothetical protein
MNDDRVLGVRQLSDGEELVAYVEPAAPLAVGGKIPLVAAAERRNRALAERPRKPADPWQHRAAAPPPR